MPTTNLPGTSSHSTLWTASKSGAVFPCFSKEASGARDASGCLLDPRELAEWILADEVPARLGLQIHKFIWRPAMKGV